MSGSADTTSQIGACVVLPIIFSAIFIAYAMMTVFAGAAQDLAMNSIIASLIALTFSILYVGAQIGRVAGKLEQKSA